MRTAVVIDYQNVHLTGAKLFFGDHAVLHEHVIEPGRYAAELIQARNATQRPGYPAAILEKVEVYRGLPITRHDPEDYARNQAQKSAWMKDPRVAVHLRPLKYVYRWDGAQQVVVSKREKGVDVLCALATVRLAREFDLVILASQDSDLEPALDEVLAMRRAKIETASWYEPAAWSRQLRPTDPTKRIWNTRLDRLVFNRSKDNRTYP